jgi:K+ transporter
MENNFEGPPSAKDAAAQLRNLASDRQALADNVRVPRALLAALGGVAAWWVALAATASPGENYEPPVSGWLVLVAVLVIMHLIRRETGIRFRKMGARAAMATIAILAVCLILFSISLGLVSFGAYWAVGLTSLSAFVLVTWLAGIAYRSALDQLRDG